jgi:hypothetical protein
MSVFERLPFDGLPIGKPAPQEPTAPAPEPATPSPIKTHWEGFWLGVGYDFFIVFICLLSLYLAALEDEHAGFFFIVVRAGLAVCELFRAPLARLARLHGSAKWRGLCVSAVFALALVTAINLFFPLNKGMRDAIAPVQDARAALETVEAIPAQLQKDVESKREIWNSALARAQDDNHAIGNQASDHCWKHHCKNNARGSELAAASSAVEAAKKAFDAADAALQKWNKGSGVEALHKAHEIYRKAANKNWVFGSVATLLRVDAETISPNGMSLALNALTIPFCLLAGLLGSVMLLGSVERIAPAKKKPAPVEAPDGEDTIKIDGDGLAELEAAASEYGQTLHEAEEVLRDDSTTPEPPAPAKDEPPADNAKKAARTRKNAAVDGRSRAAKAAKREKGKANNVLRFPPKKQDIIDDDIPF